MPRDKEKTTTVQAVVVIRFKVKPGRDLSDAFARAVSDLAMSDDTLSLAWTRLTAPTGKPPTRVRRRPAVAPAGDGKL